MSSARILTICVVMTALSLASFSATARGHKFLNFDVPGAASTLPMSINDQNDIAGIYTDQSGKEHGFVRSSTGDITKFDPPNSTNTDPLSVNNNRVISGGFEDSSSSFHGFIRAADGTITIVDVPNALATFGGSINDQGEMSGTYQDANFRQHAFVRRTNGAIATYDPDGSFGTFGGAINKHREIIGFYCPVACGSETNGYVRSAKGSISTFSVSGAVKTEPFFINSSGLAVGLWYDNFNHPAEFMRDPSGTITTPAGCQWITGLTDKGWVVGFNTDGNDVNYGCLQAPDGTLTAFNDPDAGAGIGGGTQPSAINNNRYVTGSYDDSSRVAHGFLVLPKK